MLKTKSKFIFKGNEYKVMRVSKEATEYYKKSTNNNSDLSRRKINLKLTRCVILGEKQGLNDRGQMIYTYGNLIIYVNEKANRVEYIVNRIGNYRCKINQADKVGLDNILFRDGLSKREYKHFKRKKVDKYNKINSKGGNNQC